jgi:hypothetical protein
LDDTKIDPTLHVRVMNTPYRPRETVPQCIGAAQVLEGRLMNKEPKGRLYIDRSSEVLAQGQQTYTTLIHNIVMHLQQLDRKICQWENWGGY